ncbi:uncharacterized protein [Littorina saxatilis]|uniref:uncharacterized protein n=1 Tax=Littorina saxatilis TaxID=31220 RepID=UPI0038B47ABC
MGRVPWLLCLHALTFLCTLPSVTGQCAEFEFPTRNNPDSYTVKLGAQINLPFKLDFANCDENISDSYTITVIKENKAQQIVTDVCKMVINSTGICYNFRPTDCVCKDEHGFFSVIKTMSASDESLWKWKVNDKEIAADRVMRFEIYKYPPSVNQLTFRSTSDNATLTQPLEPDMSVDIICIYDEGYPAASSAVLKNSQGKLMANSSNGSVRHRLASVSCSDMGEISCEVPGATDNMTKPLFVKCPPELSAHGSPFVSHSGLPTKLSFTLTSYTKRLTGCKITKVSQGHHTRQGQNESHEEHGEKTRSFANNYLIWGSPPNLTLQLLLDEVKQKDVGEWVLTVVNDAGTDDVTFELKIEILPQVIELSLDNSTSSQTVEVNSSVDILCAFRKGDYPNAEVILRMATGTKLTAEIPAADQHRNNKIEARYTMESVGCEDSGEISCELPKAWRNATATLLVKCPPRYTEEVVKIFPGIEGDPMELRFQLITHTQAISGCHVTKVSQGHHEDLGHNRTHTDEASGAAEFQECRQFASGYKINGTLPQGTLDIKLDRLSQDHNGTWRLTISNEAGSASFNFKLEITKAKQSAVASIKNNSGYLAGVVIAVIIIVVVVIVVVVVLVRYRERVREMMQRYIR